MADDERPGGDDASPDLQLPSLRSAFRRLRRPPRTTEAAQQEEPSPIGSPVTTQSRQPDPAPEPRKGRAPHLSVHIQLPGPLVAVVSGALVGLALVGLTSAGLGLCSSWRGTSSCGQPGLLLLLAITALVIALGALLLGAGRVTMPGSTSLLGTGLLVVLILLALIPALDQWWVVIVVPVLAALTYLAAWWLTTTYAEPGERSR